MSNNVIKSTDVRSKLLKIPPGWKNVKVSKDPSDYLQVVGQDKKGKSQYIYHPLFTALTEYEKFERLKKFCKLLPRLLSAIRSHSQPKQQFSNEYIMTLLFRMMLITNIRIGNECYKDSYGLTTLEKRHINIIGDKIIFDFVGKKQVKQHIEITSTSISNDLRKLTHGLAKTDKIFKIDSYTLNEYLKKVMGDDSITCKDFRTFTSNKLFVEELCNTTVATVAVATESERKKIIKNAYQNVAKKLGHSDFISKKSYVFPEIAQKYLKEPQFFKKGSNPVELIIKLLS